MLTILHGGDTRDLCSNFNIAMFLHFINGSCNGIIFSNFKQESKKFQIIITQNYSVYSSRSSLEETLETPGRRKLQATRKKKKKENIRHIRVNSKISSYSPVDQCLKCPFKRDITCRYNLT